MLTTNYKLFTMQLCNNELELENCMKSFKTELGFVALIGSGLFYVEGEMEGHRFLYTTTSEKQAKNMYKNVVKQITPIQKEKPVKDRVDLGCSPSTKVETIGA